MTAPLYDVAVIGAGIGGLTAAALSAHDRRSTLLLEAHNRPGGCAGDFALNGVLFPAGATLISGFEADGLHAWVYDRLGISNRAEPLDQAMEIVAPDRRFTLWTERARWDEEARSAFDGDHTGRERFLHWTETVGSAVHRLASRRPVLPPRSPRDLIRLAAALRPDVLRTLPYLHRTAGSVLLSCGAAHDPLFAQFVDAQLLDATGCEAATSAAVTGAIALDLYHHGCFGMPGGPAEIARDLLRAFRRDGGQARFEAVVIAIRRDGHGAWQVKTAGGDTIRARCVISNAPAWDMSVLLGAQASRTLSRATGLRRHGWGAFVLHAAVDPSVLPARQHAHFQTLPRPGQRLDEGGMCFITVMPPSGPPGAPRAVSASTHTDAGRWWMLSDDGYREHKARYTEQLLAACERAIPGFNRGLIFSRSATPRTFARYTQRGWGIVGGVRNDLRHTLFRSLSHRSGLPGLYLCGDSIFPGQGTVGVTLSGINAWRSACDYLDTVSRRRWGGAVADSGPSPTQGAGVTAGSMSRRDGAATDAARVA
jgi:C-3',4' desaturase CrtD